MGHYSVVDRTPFCPDGTLNRTRGDTNGQQMGHHFAQMGHKMGHHFDTWDTKWDTILPKWDTILTHGTPMDIRMVSDAVIVKP
jgi:hypothetical protein